MGPQDKEYTRTEKRKILRLAAKIVVSATEDDPFGSCFAIREATYQLGLNNIVKRVSLMHRYGAFFDKDCGLHWFPFEIRFKEPRAICLLLFRESL